MSHITTDFQNPLWSGLFRRLAEHHQFVRYDARGIGLSDRDVMDITFEDFLVDLETAVDSLELEKFSLLGVSMGASIALAYAQKHPERIDRLALHGAFAIGRRRRNSSSDLDRAKPLPFPHARGMG